MVVALLVYALVRFEFALAAVALAALITAQLFLPAVADHPSADDRSTTFTVTGGVLVLIGLSLDSRDRRRAAFWSHGLGLGGVAVGLVYFAGSEGSDGAWGRGC
jgi:peptidoglycan/LPS O-acetylase OafA/YrhL